MKTTAMAAMLFCGLPLAHASTSFLITNGDFETGTLASWTAATQPPFMNVTGSCNDGFAALASAIGCATGTNPAFGTFAAYSSTSFPAVSNDVGEWDNTLSQNFVVPTGTIANASLSLEYTATWAGSSTGLHGVNVEAEILQGSTFLFSDPLVINPNGPGNVSWTLSSADLTSVLAAHQGQTLTLQLLSIGFYDTRGGGVGAANSLITGYDNVQIAVDSGVPEPGSVWMAAGGLLLVAASRVARRRA